jgi:hypothetical protein
VPRFKGVDIRTHDPVAIAPMAKKSKKKSKGKVPDLHKITGKMNEADALLQCPLRRLKQRCSPTDAGAERLWLYDEITVLQKSAKAYSKVYEQIDLYELHAG